MNMVSRQTIVTNRLGLHARAAAKLVRMAAHFEASVKLRRLDAAVTADAKSILSVLALAASKGTNLTIECEGHDEEVAMQSVLELFESGFGEE